MYQWFIFVENGFRLFSFLIWCRNCIKEEPLSRISRKLKKNYRIFHKIFRKTIYSSAYDIRWIHVWVEVFLTIFKIAFRKTFWKFREKFFEFLGNSRDRFFFNTISISWLVENWQRKVWNHFPQKWITVTPSDLALDNEHSP